jgi:ABC-2 type transport system ATP-binding protein
MNDPVLSIRALRKEYGTGVQALKSVDLDIRRGEIFALLGPNGAGKTTLINIVCGIVTPTSGEVLIDGRNWQSDYRYARERIGLVPQELTTEAFEPAPVAMGQAQDDHDAAFGRHEAAGDDRQGAQP